MPIWYAEQRTSILLIQSVVGVLVFAYSLKRRSHFWLRLAGETVLGFAALHLMRLVFFRTWAAT